MFIYEHALKNLDTRYHFNYLLKHLKFAEYAGLLQRGYLWTYKDKTWSEAPFQFFIEAFEICWVCRSAATGVFYIILTVCFTIVPSESFINMFCNVQKIFTIAPKVGITKFLPFKTNETDKSGVAWTRTLPSLYVRTQLHFPKLRLKTLSGK